MDLDLIDYHEAAHSVVANVFGWACGPVTVAGGSKWAGCSLAAPPLVVCGAFDADQPFCTWPPTLQHRIETDVIMRAAGDVAERLLWAPPLGRGPEPVIAVAAELAGALELAGAPPDEAEQRWAAAAVEDAAMPSDAERIAEAARCAFVGDPAGCAAWLLYLERQCEQLVIRHSGQIRRLAAHLHERQVLSGDQVQALLKQRATLAAV